MRQILPILCCLLLLACGSGDTLPPEGAPRIVVLGFDGVDPDLTSEWIDQLPNIKRLSETGTVAPLGTTNPPESPVAWASFSTGMNPGKHGIFDFLRRDPQTYLPEIGLTEIKQPELFFDSIQFKGYEVINKRKGLTYWEHLDAASIPTVNLRMPLEFPPAAINHGQTWSGLSVPDILGTWGTYFYLATDATQWDLGDTEFGGRRVRLESEDNTTFTATLEGPVDPTSESSARLTIPLECWLNEDGTAVTLIVQGQEETIDEGQWSDWFEFEFSFGTFSKISGISRFRVIETFPEIRLYLLPLSINPKAAVFPISQPEGFMPSLVDDFGYFKTLGWMHETWGLNEEQIDEEIFLEDLFRNMADLEKILLQSLKEEKASVYTAIFTATDSVSHMFYRLLDTEHPRYDPTLAEDYGDAILRVYKRMDEIIGTVMGQLEEDDWLLIVSDHGFHSWKTEFNTNTWLARNGFLTLSAEGSPEQDPSLFTGGSFFPNVNWEKTKAYSLGLGHIYINLKGREKYGSVQPGEEYDRLVSEIRSKIIEYQDPDTGVNPVQATYFRGDIYTGDQIEEAGDIQLAFRSGFRTSWETTLGAVPADIVVANFKKWSGDHAASDLSDTAGILISNRKITTADPNLVDIAPTLYKVFGLPLPDVDGKALEWEPAPGN
ncbi:MAG: alkaline phosphatase family protein [Acidobacteriota bacterium]|nr:MAG: alkaline phosphatase family protein [Acidobacteriota bacterium]